MSYQKQNFKNGDKLKAEQLNHIEDGVVQIEAALDDIANNGNTKLYKHYINITASYTGVYEDPDSGETYDEIYEAKLYGCVLYSSDNVSYTNENAAVEDLAKLIPLGKRLNAPGDIAWSGDNYSICGIEHNYEYGTFHCMLINNFLDYSFEFNITDEWTINITDEVSEV